MPGMSDDSSDLSASSSGIQVDLAPDDLKKAQVHAVHLDMRETASTLRVPGSVNPDEYKEVHVTPLVAASFDRFQCTRRSREARPDSRSGFQQ